MSIFRGNVNRYWTVNSHQWCNSLTWLRWLETRDPWPLFDFSFPLHVLINRRKNNRLYYVLILLSRDRGSMDVVWLSYITRLYYYQSWWQQCFRDSVSLFCVGKFLNMNGIFTKEAKYLNEKFLFTKLGICASENIYTSKDGKIIFTVHHRQGPCFAHVCINRSKESSSSSSKREKKKKKERWQLYGHVKQRWQCYMT